MWSKTTEYGKNILEVTEDWSVRGEYVGRGKDEWLGNTLLYIVKHCTNSPWKVYSGTTLTSGNQGLLIITKKMKLPFKVCVNGRSKEIQEHLFSLGCMWLYDALTVQQLDRPFLFIDEDKIISYSQDIGTFIDDDGLELTAEQVLNL